MNQESFDKLWWAAQPPRVRGLKDLPVDTSRTALALELAQQGFTIFIPVCVYGWSPYGVMSCYAANGFKWVPALLQTGFTVAQNPIGPDEISQNAPIPKGAIKISLDATDYPPFDPPVPVVPTKPLGNPVGFALYLNIWAGSPGDNLADWPENSSYEDSRGKFIKRVGKPSPFGTPVWWEKLG